MSDLEVGRGRPLVVLELELEVVEARREDSWEVKARVVEEDISFFVALGLRKP